jgi:tetratricopeptide (TPR) repeat protein
LSDAGPNLAAVCPVWVVFLPGDAVSELSEAEMTQFRDAVRTFRDQGRVRVTAEKLHAYLDQTRDVPASPSNRLRWLAIQLEHASFEHGWDDLRTIYRAAAAADPADYRVFHSWGLSASNFVAPGANTLDPAARRTISEEAERALLAALELSPRDSHVAHTLGLVHYNHPDYAESYQPRAIEWFARAVEWDSRKVIAQLYLAHCYHDRKDWPRAIAEYERVDLEALARDWPAWRAVKCREQIAHCHAFAGNTDEAVRRFIALLDEVETWDKARTDEAVVNVDELVQAVTQKLDHPDLLRRTRDLVQRLKLAVRYPQLR